MAGVAIDEADGFRQLTMLDEDVVGEMERVEMPDAVVEGRLVHEAVRLGLNNVANSDEGGAAGESLEQRGRGGFGERGPADDSGDKRMGCSHFEEPCVFNKGLAGLDGDDRVD